LQRHMIDNKRTSAWIDQEIFSNLSYPDVLVSGVHELMRGIHQAVSNQTPEVGTRWARRLFSRKAGPKSSSPIRRLIRELAQAVSDLDKLRYAPLDRKIEWVVLNEDTDKLNTAGSLRMQIAS